MIKKIKTGSSILQNARNSMTILPVFYLKVVWKQLMNINHHFSMIEKHFYYTLECKDFDGDTPECVSQNCLEQVDRYKPSMFHDRTNKSASSILQNARNSMVILPKLYLQPSLFFDPRGQHVDRHKPSFPSSSGVLVKPDGGALS